MLWMWKHYLLRTNLIAQIAAITATPPFFFHSFMNEYHISLFTQFSEPKE